MRNFSQFCGQNSQVLILEFALPFLKQILAVRYDQNNNQIKMT